MASVIQLTQQHGERNAVHVAVANRLRQQLNDKAESCQAGDDANDTGNQRHHSSKSHRTIRISSRERQNNCEDDRSER
jgi:hypothetical protein